MIYTVVVIREEDGQYSACIPALNNVASFGDTLPEALTMVEEAATLYLETIQGMGRSVPPDNPHINLDMTDVGEAIVCKMDLQEEIPVA